MTSNPQIPAQEHPWYELPRLRATARFGVTMFLVTIIATHILFSTVGGSSFAMYLSFLRSTLVMWLLFAAVAVLIMWVMFPRLQAWHMALQPFVHAVAYAAVLFMVMLIVDLVMPPGGPLGPVIVVIALLVVIPAVLCSIVA